MPRRSIFTTLAVISLTLGLSGCIKSDPDAHDPYEKFNRPVFKFNDSLDKMIFKPTAEAYKNITPYPVRQGVTNFFNNLRMVPTIINDVLQLQGQQTIKDSWRLTINSTFGVAGLIDVAKSMSLPEHYNDFGTTFYYLGDRHSPFIMIPFAGPNTLRDATGDALRIGMTIAATQNISDKISYTLAGVSLIDTRSQLLEAEGIIDTASLDPYVLMRDAYLQNRRHQIKQNLGKRYPQDAEQTNEHGLSNDIYEDAPEG